MKRKQFKMSNSSLQFVKHFLIRLMNWIYFQVNQLKQKNKLMINKIRMKTKYQLVIKLPKYQKTNVKTKVKLENQTVLTLIKSTMIKFIN
jgi:hypothetical protein